MAAAAAVAASLRISKKRAAKRTCYIAYAAPVAVSS